MGFFDPLALSLPDPAAFELLSTAVAGVDTGTSGVGSFDASGMPAFGGKVAEFSINPIIGESGVDRVLVSGLLLI